jgi:hypothetical protein
MSLPSASDNCLQCLIKNVNERVGIEGVAILVAGFMEIYEKKTQAERDRLKSKLAEIFPN